MSEILATAAAEILEGVPAPATPATVVNPTEIEEDRFLRSSEMHVKLQERVQIIGMRRSWSNWILVAILVLVAFDMVFIVFVGLGWLVYTSTAVLDVILAQTLAQIVGLALIVVGFLFHKDSLMK